MVQSLTSHTAYAIVGSMVQSLRHFQKYTTWSEMTMFIFKAILAKVRDQRAKISSK